MGFPCIGQFIPVGIRGVSHDGVDRRAAILGITKGHDPGDARSADGDVGPFPAALLAKHVVEREDPRCRNCEAPSALGAAVHIVRNDCSIGGIHDEVVGVIGDKVNRVLSRGIAAHVEISVVAHREVVATAIDEGAVPKGKVSSGSVARPGNDRVDR